jgi:hypothetical protein
MPIKITEKWLLDRGAAEALDVTAGSRDDSALLIEAERERKKEARIRIQNRVASLAPVKQ